MTPTHVHRTERDFKVTAWRNDPKAPIPLWVFRQFHDLDGDGRRTSSAMASADVGDWIVNFGTASGVMKDANFNAAFEPIQQQ